MPYRYTSPHTQLWEGERVSEWESEWVGEREWVSGRVSEWERESEWVGERVSEWEGEWVSGRERVSECSSGHQLAVSGYAAGRVSGEMMSAINPLTNDSGADCYESKWTVHMLLCQPLLCHSSSTPVSDSSLEHCSSSPAALCAVYQINTHHDSESWLSCSRCLSLPYCSCLLLPTVEYTTVTVHSSHLKLPCAAISDRADHETACCRACTIFPQGMEQVSPSICYERSLLPVSVGLTLC